MRAGPGEAKPGEAGRGAEKHGTALRRAAIQGFLTPQHRKEAEWNGKITDKTNLRRPVPGDSLKDRRQRRDELRLRRTLPIPSAHA